MQQELKYDSNCNISQWNTFPLDTVLDNQLDVSAP